MVNQQPGILPVVIGTAGHIDHGKSSLVKALTGIDPDRLKEEKERGLTIDLGFANMRLPGGLRVGVVDVPGHERFVRNMVAGATGIDLALLVVAADDGVMPQTREHVDILSLLGVEGCVVAVTKADLVEEDLRELVAEEARELVAAAGLALRGLVQVSSVTGEGIEELQGLLAREASAARPRTAEGIFRMPVQRVFIRPGFGTVVTGIPTSGRVKVGDLLEVVPGGARGRVRGLHAYGGAIAEGRAGHSTAVNLTDVEVSRVHRGDVLAPPGVLAWRNRFSVRLRALPSAPPLRHMAPVRFHVGTLEVLGRLSLLDRDVLAPGEECYAQVLAREPAVACLGDRFLLRLETPPCTVGGGLVLEAGRRRSRRHRPEVLERLRVVETSREDPGALLVLAAGAVGLEGLTPQDAQGAVPLPLPEIRALLGDLSEQGRLVRVPRSERYLHPDTVAQAASAVDGAFREHFARHPLALKLHKAALREASGLPPDVMDAVLEIRCARGDLTALPDGCFAPASRKADMGPAEAEDLGRLLAVLEGAGHAPRTRQEAAQAAGLESGRLELLLARARDDGSVVEIGREFLYARRPYEEARRAVVENCRRNARELVIPELRDRLGTTRKYLIPLLEHFDTVGLTRRRGTVRVLGQAEGAD